MAKQFLGAAKRAGVVATTAPASSAAVAVATPSGAVAVPNTQGFMGNWTNIIAQITGVNAGGTSNIVIPVGQRIHEIRLQCGGGTTFTTAPTFTATSGGTSTVVTGVLGTGLQAGMVIGLTITTAGSGQTNGTVTIVGAGGGGTGAVISLVIAGGIGVSATILAQGGGGWVNPTYFFAGPLQVQVNSATIRNIGPAAILGICAENGCPAQNGQLPIYFTEPWRVFIKNNTATSWDLLNAQYCQIQAPVSSVIVNPTLTGDYDFDFIPNQVTTAQGVVQALHIVSQSLFTTTLLGGNNQTPINTIWQPGGDPIIRMWFQGATANQITQLQIVMDGKLVLQEYPNQISQRLAAFKFAALGGGLTNGGLNTTVPSGIVATPFDTAAISDPDQRFWKCWRPQKTFVLYVYSNVAQNINIFTETLKSGYY